MSIENIFPWYSTPFDFLSLPGDPRVWIFLALIFLVADRFLPDDKKVLTRRIVFLILPTAILSFGTSYALKNLLGIPRPCIGLPNCPTDFDLPSSHTAVAFSVFTVIGYLTSYWALLIAVIVGVSRYLAGVHSLAGVMSGAVLGVIIGAMVIKCFRDGIGEYFKEKKSRRRK